MIIAACIVAYLVSVGITAYIAGKIGSIDLLAMAFLGPVCLPILLFIGFILFCHDLGER